MNSGYQKYVPFQQIDLPDRQWPSRVIEKAPIWCSVDLRDGNQALVTPMNLQEKLDYFKALCDMGFKEIEVGFPSASETEYEICRELIEGGHIPDDVTIQVLVQAREHLIRKTFEAIRGAKNVIVHFYNSTSTLQRKVVFHKEMDGIIDIAVQGAKLIKELTDSYDGDTNIRFEYSPESFSGTEMDNAVAICDEVMKVLGSTAENPVILNLPNTVEMCTPNTYADQVEYFIRHLPHPEAAIISVHPHNDRGTGVAGAELALLAGAQRVEGTLFGNGERTGNLDIVTMGLNIRRSRGLLFLSTTLLAGTVTAFCGPIGFIGLAMPHVARMLFRNGDHRVLVPGTILSGAAVLLLCDLVSKFFTLPINAITALLGIPIVVWVVLRNKSFTA